MDLLSRYSCIRFNTTPEMALFVKMFLNVVTDKFSDKTNVVPGQRVSGNRCETSDCMKALSGVFLRVDIDLVYSLAM